MLSMSITTLDRLHRDIQELRGSLNLVILAHNYQPQWIKELADFTGDSLQLSRQAAGTSADMVVFCGVRFMAETAKILSPGKTVILPSPDAGCSLADSITPEELLEWKIQYPEALVVSYVNTSAEVKAMTDVCCTSSNALEIIQRIPTDREILFLPDFFLGSYVKELTGRSNIHLWMGECHVHADISPEHLATTISEHPQASVFVHPECGCTTPSLYELRSHSDKVEFLSTTQMIERASRIESGDVLVATEIGLLPDLKLANPRINFLPVNPRARCPYMNLTTPGQLLEAIRTRSEAIELDPETIKRASAAVRRMIEPDSVDWEQL